MVRKKKPHAKSIGDIDKPGATSRFGERIGEELKDYELKMAEPLPTRLETAITKLETAIDKAIAKLQRMV